MRRVGAEDNPTEVEGIRPEAVAVVLRMRSGVEVEVDCWLAAAIPRAELRPVERKAAFRSSRRTQYLADWSRHSAGK
jgi:hypothetical protein